MMQSVNLNQLPPEIPVLAAEVQPAQKQNSGAETSFSSMVREEGARLREPERAARQQPSERQEAPLAESEEVLQDEQFQMPDALLSSQIQAEPNHSARPSEDQQITLDIDLENFDIAAQISAAEESSAELEEFSRLAARGASLAEDALPSSAEEQDASLVAEAKISAEPELLEEPDIPLARPAKADGLELAAGIAAQNLAQDSLQNQARSEAKNENSAERLAVRAAPAASSRKPKITVTDLRREAPQKAEGASAIREAAKAALKGESVASASNSGEARMEFSLNAQGAAALAAQDMTSSSGQTAASQGSQFQAMLSNQIQANAAEFVRAGNIVLKDGGMGSINLVMHPESLGNVKISLELSDKVISGQITVASREAYEAFRESIGSLQQAFAESGFESAGFNLSFAGQGGRNQGGFAENSEQFRMMRGERTYGSMLEDEGLAGIPDSFDGAEFAVNVVA